uniref:Rad50/SbcC-type AAA domain-containing protein n=1 Tax=Ananas comosus var. bracteatus TaxID=296719 RepID=A0A6V7QAI4_ANACO|nr:unnamed protein product [Ananas comosus var. bracteatus]
MADSGDFRGPAATSARPGAGIISRIRVENFMCGKSAILTALCVAFGCRAKGTQRAATLKDFIKTGCSYAAIFVEMKNQGEDAFKPEVYGNLIIIERRITESTSSLVLKDHQGRKVAHRRDDLQELIEHFNIDVENPCVIMSQDKSREFLHSGNDRDKFKFFFKATLLQQVSDLLDNIRNQLRTAASIVEELEKSISPIMRELDELHEKIKNMEHVEEIAQELQDLRKKLAWSWVYDVDKQIEEQNAKIEKLKERIPACQDKIDRNSAKVEELKGQLIDKKAHVTSLMQKTSEVRRMQDELQNKLSLATKEQLELKEEHSRGENLIKKMTGRLKSLEQQIRDIQEQHIRDTQAEESAAEECMKKQQDEIDAARSSVKRLQEEENALAESLSEVSNTINNLTKEVEENERRYRDLCSQIRELQQRQTNKKLVSGDIWALAVDCAIGKLLDAFIVTNHKDSLVLRDCAREANYRNLQIIIYDFAKPRISIPHHLLPSTNHPTTLSVLQSDNPTVLNVLVDMGHAERQVLVQDYEMGKSVAFEQRVQNLKEVYTSDGYRMFYRGSVQTTLPPNRRMRTGRLCSSLDDRIDNIQKEASNIKENIQECKGRKRNAEEARRDVDVRIQSVKRRCLNEDRLLMSKQMKLQDMKNNFAAENNHEPAPNVEEIYEEISQVQDSIQGKELTLEKIKVKLSMAEEKSSDLKRSFESLCDSAEDEMEAIDLAGSELQLIEEKLQSADEERAHYEGIMQQKVLPDIKKAEEEHEELQRNRQENFRKASIICSESEVEALGGCDGATPEQLSSKMNRLKQRHQKESQRYTESIDDLRALHDKKERKILRKQLMYAAFREKLNACERALDLRWNKFQRNASLLKRQLTWQFNGHLRKKGISGHIKVDYEEKVLTVEVKMPQDASGNTVRDTRGLSGGERSFSTLCFALVSTK